MKRIAELYKESFAGLPKEVWMLAAVMFVNRCGSIVLFFLVLYLTSQLGFSVSEAGIIISFYGGGSLLGSYLGGVFTDRFGTNRVQIFSLFATGITIVILDFLTAYYMIASVVFLWAIVEGLFRPANNTAVSEACTGEIRPRGFVLNRLAINLGVAIGPAVGGFLATIDYSYLFWVDGITCICAAFLMIFFFNGTNFGIKKVKVAGETIISPWSDKGFLFILLLLLFMGIVFVQLFNTWPLHLREACFLSEDKIGLLLGLNAIFLVIVEMPLIHKLENFNTLKVIAIGSLFMFGGYALTSLNTSYIYLAFTVIVWTIGEMLVFPLVAAFIANRAADNNRGRYMGMFSFTFSLSFIIGPILGMWIYEQFGSSNLWMSIGLLGIFVFAGFLLFERKQN
ncbi:MAG: MFS transporter [Melioribacteraceae bacterium]|nr:MFS transporter [Melioribacteraceae bacterium]